MAFSPTTNNDNKYGAYPHKNRDKEKYLEEKRKQEFLSQMYQQQQAAQQQASQQMLQGQTTQTMVSSLGGMFGPLGQITNTPGSTVQISPPTIRWTTSMQSITSVGVPAVPAVNLHKIDELSKVEPRKITNKIPDGITPIIAYRAWDVVICEENSSGEYRLKAIGTGYNWEPKKAIHATCTHQLNHKAPFKACTCGIWCFKTMDILKPAIANYSNIMVVGAIDIWGKIIETENGFRAEYAYPRELWLMSNEHEELGIIYNVPIRTL